MLPSDSFKTVRVTFTQGSKTEKKEVFFHIAASLITKDNSIKDIVKRALTPENIESKLPVTIRDIPPENSQAVNISNIAIKKIAGNISHQLTYLETVKELYSQHHYLFFPLARVFIVLIRALFRSDKAFPAAVKTPEGSLALMGFMAKTAKTLGGDNLLGLANHAKDAKRWSSDLINGRKKEADLKSKISKLKEGESFSLILGYWRKSGFCPLILTVTKKDNSYSLDSFCVDEKLGERVSAHRSWSDCKDEDLASCLIRATSFTKKPGADYFKDDITPGTATGYLAKKAADAAGSLAGLDLSKLTPASLEQESIDDPSAALFEVFSKLGKQEIDRSVKTDRWDSVIKHWHNHVFTLNPTDKVLFQSNLKLTFMNSLVKEIMSSKTSSHDKWERLSSLQKEMADLKAKIQKEIQDPLLAATLEQTITTLDKAVEIAFNSLTSELNRPLHTRKMPKIALISPSADNVGVNVTAEIKSLRDLRKNLTKDNFLTTLPDYVKNLEALGDKQAWQRLSDSTLSFLQMIPEITDSFWNTINPSDIPEVSKSFARIVELQFESEVHVRDANPPSYVVKELGKTHKILKQLHARRAQYVCNNIWKKAIRDYPGKAEDLFKKLVECRSLLAKAIQSEINDYENQILYIKKDNSKDTVQAPLIHQFTTIELAQHVNVCKELGISLSDCLELLAGDGTVDFNSSSNTAFCSPLKNESPLNNTSLPLPEEEEKYYGEIKMSVFETAAKYYGKDSSLQTPYPVCYEAAVRSRTYLQILNGERGWEFGQPLSEDKLQIAKKEAEKVGFREKIPESVIGCLAGKNHSINELKKNRIALKWEGGLYAEHQKACFKGTRIRFLPPLKSYLYPPFFISLYLSMKNQDRAVAKYGQSWRGGLKGKIPRDLLECLTDSESYYDIWCSSKVSLLNTPEAMAIIEQEDPSLENLPFTLRIAMRNLCANVSSKNPSSSIFLNSFLQEHAKYLELEEVQRRIEFSIYQENLVPDKALCSKLATAAIESKQDKAAGFLFSLGSENLVTAKEFYREKLSDTSLSPIDKKLFATFTLKMLLENSPWKADDWQLACQAFKLMTSCAEESGNPELQQQMIFYFKEKMIPQLQELETNTRNTILSSLLTPPQNDLTWEQEGENWKAIGTTIVFDTSTASVVEDGATGPVPDSIYLHPDYRQLFGSKRHVARTKLLEGKTFYHFDPYTLEWGKTGLIIRQKIDGKLCKWARLSLQKTELDPRLQGILEKGVWLDSDTAQKGTVVVGKEQLRVYFTKGWQGKLTLKNITNKGGYNLVLPEEQPGLFGFAPKESTLVFVNWRQKLHQALFIDRDQRIQRTKNGFSFAEKARNIEEPIALSNQQLREAFTATTASFPKYGTVCSSKENTLILQLFFPKKRDSKRALTLYLEKQTLDGTCPQLTGSTMGFLFLSEQAASEGQFEKAAEFLQKAKFSPFLSEEKNDFDSFMKALQDFDARSLPAKVWKLKCLILAMQIQQEKLQRPILDTSNPSISLKKMQEVVSLHNEIKQTLSGTKSERKQRRIAGSLAISQEETQFLQKLSQKALSEFLSQGSSQTAQPAATSITNSQMGPPFKVLSGLLARQPWLYSDFLQKPTSKKSLLNLSVYPSPQELVRGFTSFAKEIAGADENKTASLTAHLKSLHVGGMSSQNQLIAKNLIDTLLQIQNLDTEKKRELIQALDKLAKTVAPEVVLDPNHKQSSAEKLAAYANKLAADLQAKLDALGTFLDQPDQSSPSASVSNAAQTPQKNTSSLEEKINTSSLEPAQKEKWLKLLRNCEKKANINLIEFLEEALKLNENLVSEHLALEIKKEMQNTQPLQRAPANSITLTLPKDIQTNWLSDHVTEKNEPFDVSEKLGEVLAETKDTLVNLELDRIRETKVPDVTTYTIKNPRAFQRACAAKKKALTSHVQKQIAVLGEKHSENLEHSAFERFERLVDRFVVDNKPFDPLISEILTTLVAIKQLEGSDPAAISQAFNLGRLGSLTPAQSRATLIGEYRSGHVSRPFQPNLIQKLSDNENTVVLSPPGSGKSTTILPVTAQVIAKEQGKFPVILLTDELFHLGKEGFDKTTKSLFQQASCVFTFDRNTEKDVGYLAQEAEKIGLAKKTGAYVVTTISQLASLENELIFQMEEREKKIQKKKDVDPNQKDALEKEKALDKEISLLSQKIDWLQEIWGLFHNDNTRFIADEIDELYRPNIDYNYALGTPDSIAENIREACNLVMTTLMLEAENSDFSALSTAIQTGDQSKLPETERKSCIEALAKKVSLKAFGTEAHYKELTDATTTAPIFDTEEEKENFAHLRKILSSTLPNMPLYPGSQYGPTKQGITIVPKRKGLEAEGTRFSDPYELSFMHYLYYAVNSPNAEYLKTFWIHKESELRNGAAKEPWNDWKIWWEESVQNLPTDERYKMLNERLQQPGSAKERLDIVNHDISEKIGLFPFQIRSNAHEVLCGAKVCGASGTINPDALGSNFQKDASLIERIVMKQTLAQIDLDEPLSVVKDPDDFFKKQAQNEKICGIIDQAGLQKNRSSLEIAALLRNASDKKRQILFIHPIYRNKWMWNPNEDSPRAFIGNADKNCLCYYGEADSRGTDWVLPNKEFALVVGPSCGDDDFIQAYYRARKAGKGQTVRFFVEEGMMVPDSTNKDLMKKIIRQGALERAPINFKAAMRNLLAIRSHEMRKQMFSPRNTQDEKLFPKMQKYLVQERSSNIESLLEASKQEDTATFLTRFAQNEQNLCNTLNLEGTSTALTTFSNSISTLQGLPDQISVKDLSSGDTETVQEQVEVTEQVQVSEQVQEQTQETSSQSFSLNTDLKLPTDHETSNWDLLVDLFGYTHLSQQIYKNNFNKDQILKFAFQSASATKQLEVFKKKQGFGNKNSFVWLARKNSYNDAWTFTLIDSLTYAVLKEKNGLKDNEFIMKPFSDDVPRQNNPFLLEVPSNSTLSYESLDKEKELFWHGFTEAKILSGCWSFPTEKEKAALTAYLNFMWTEEQKKPELASAVGKVYQYIYRSPFKLKKDFLLNHLCKPSIAHRLGSTKAADYTLPKEFTDSDLWKTIEQVCVDKH